MDVLRAPWRMDYINSANDDASKKNITRCIFCSYPAEDNDEENLILKRGDAAFVILNRYPYSSGHVMIIPYRHTSDFSSLNDGEKLEIMTLAQKSVTVIEKTLNPDGFNMGINIGRSAGAGIDSHIHLHVVPRWSGDTNFMSVTAETKVLPEALIVTRKRLMETWARINP
jgi:ATP adenylyltransferase